MLGDDRTLVPEALEHLDPRGLDYNGWLAVAMALHAEGYPEGTYADWLSAHGVPVDERTIHNKWRGFGNGGGEVRGGTIVEMARRQGWNPERRAGGSEPDVALDWDAPITGMLAGVEWAEPADVPEPERWDPAAQAAAYLRALFDSEDVVGFVTSATQTEKGRWVPKGKGSYTKTAGELIDDLTRTGSIEEALGTPNPEAGAWIRFNPLTGGGVRNADVAEFRYALVESDDMELADQLAKIRALELPCAAIVHSGGKSLHAIVKVEARDYAQYRERVDRLYKVCAANGMSLDTQNKNPSRLSRLPGFERGGGRQYMVEGACGKPGWREWVEWVESESDDLPEFENLAGTLADMPELAPELVGGVLRRGHKMLVAAASKTGKSYLMMELCAAIAEGGTWLGFPVARGRVIYVNLELDRASCAHRFAEVYAALGWEPEHAASIDVWNLRGKSARMDRLVPSLVRRALKVRPDAVVIDPVYKVGMGDENSAEAVGAFCNELDKVAEQVGCSVVYVHHHSKGAQGGKVSMDRASGSGVFARDADAQVDLIALPLDKDQRAAVEEKAAVEAACAWADGAMPGWRNDERASQDAMEHWETGLLPVLRGMVGSDKAKEEAMLAAVFPARARARAMAGMRAEFTLREFAGKEPVNLWFDAPIHRLDETGILGDVQPEDVRPARRKASGRGRAAAEGRARQNDESWEDVRIEFEDAIANAGRDGMPPTYDEVESYMMVGRKAVKGYCKRFGYHSEKLAGNTHLIVQNGTTLGEMGVSADVYEGYPTTEECKSKGTHQGGYPTTEECKSKGTHQGGYPTHT